MPRRMQDQPCSTGSPISIFQTVSLVLEILRHLNLLDSVKASLQRQRVALVGLQTSKGGGGVADTWKTPVALLCCSSDRNGLLVPALCRVRPVSDSASQTLQSRRLIRLGVGANANCVNTLIFTGTPTDPVAPTSRTRCTCGVQSK